MDILPNEIKEIKTVGKLFDDDVKMIITDGGFHVFVGKKKKSAKKAEAIAGASHPAIGMHQLCKDYGSDFQPALAKSEHERMPDVEDKTSYLPSDDINAGIELFTLTKNDKGEFVLYKRGLTLGKYETEASGDSLVINKSEFKYKGSEKTAQAMSRAMRDKMYEMNLSYVEKNG
jgi:hypothetical protein